MKSGYAVRTGLLALALAFGGGLLLAGSQSAFAVGESAAYEFSNASQNAGVTFHPVHPGSAHTASAAPASESLGWAFEWSGASGDAGVVLSVEKTGHAAGEVYKGNPAGEEEEGRLRNRRAADNRHPSGLTQEDAQSVLGGWFE